MACSNISVGVRIRKWFAPPYKGKWQQRFSELQAMETFKKKIAEEQTERTDYLSMLISCFQSYHTNVSPAAYSFIIKYLSQRRMLSHVYPILEQLENVESFSVSERTFVNLIQSFCWANRPHEAINIFFRIPNFRCIPSVVSLNALLAVLCKSKEGIVLVRDVLLKSPEMNIRLELSTFRILIKALCRNGKLSSAIDLMNVMKFHECEPDARLCSLLLSALCKQGYSSQVTEFLEEMRNAGFELNALQYSNLINMLVKENKVYDAYSFLVLMRMEGKRPDVMCYNKIIGGFISANDFAKADELFDEMLLVGLLPDSSTYHSYVSGLCKQGNLEKAHRMLTCMERVGCKPDLETFNTVIAGFVKMGDLTKAKELTGEVVERGLQLNSHTYKILIDGLLTRGQMEEVSQLVMEMTSMGITPLPSTLNSLVCGFCRKPLLHERNNWQEGCSTLQQHASS